MKLTEIELRRIELPLVRPFRTSFGVEVKRDVLLVRIATPESEGWGECVAGAGPFYSSEYVGGAAEVIKGHLAPMMFDADDLEAASLTQVLGGVRGHRMAKSALEVAVLDAQLRAEKRSLKDFLGGVRDRVEVGVSVEIPASIGALIELVEAYLSNGYKRIKLKIERGWDVQPVRAVRERFGDDIALQVDANAAYKPDELAHLKALDDFNLLLIEQPFGEDDLSAHAALAKSLRTPVCLDETITSVHVAKTAIEIGACSIINIKPGRVGGYFESKRIHDLCESRGVPVWCGGMLETGIGRAANLALASLSNFKLPGDISASSRYYDEDITEPFQLEDSSIAVPVGPGIGVTPISERLDEVTSSVERLAPS